MSVVVSGPGLAFFGIVAEKPPIPPGWEYRESADDWLFARDLAGRFWLVGTRFLRLMRRVRRKDVRSGRMSRRRLGELSIITKRKVRTPGKGGLRVRILFTGPNP